MLDEATNSTLYSCLKWIECEIKAHNPDFLELEDEDIRYFVNCSLDYLVLNYPFWKSVKIIVLNLKK